MRVDSIVRARPAALETGEAPVFLGHNPRIVELLDVARQAAATHAPVLITGESGTGKEILARTIHAHSARRREAFVAVNCGAITSSLEESELFGYVAGAFTGADRRKRGRFEAANGGTIFLDEVGETSPALQVKLLRVLQDGEYAPVGSARNEHCDVRVVAATNRGLSEAVRDGQFRTDLYFRLDVVRLSIPPLRERLDDVPLLARHFADDFATQYELAPPPMEARFVKRLIDHDYPGNVRELSNYLHRAVIRSRGGPLHAGLLDEPEDLQTAQGGDTPETTPAQGGRPPAGTRQGFSTDENFHEAKRKLIEVFEREYLISVLTECGGIVYRAAERAGLSERGFHLKLRHYGIDGTSFRVGG